MGASKVIAQRAGSLGARSNVRSQLPLLLLWASALESRFDGQPGQRSDCAPALPCHHRQRQLIACVRQLEVAAIAANTEGLRVDLARLQQ